MGDKIIKNVIDYIISFPSLDEDNILFSLWSGTNPFLFRADCLEIFVV